VLDKLITKLQSRAHEYAKDALEKPTKRDAFEYGVHHGYVKALSHVEQWIAELLEEQEDDDSK
jgi:hypothetical protein